MKIRRALLSVHDKTGLVEFARGLSARGIELLSSGGTAAALRAAGLAARDVSEFTGFPEMLDGRVKTLHPKVHAGLLYVRGNPQHEATMEQHGLAPIDLVCVNLYPFESTVARSDVTFEEAIEQIDIGGPTLLRSAAKNMESVTVVMDPADYPAVLAELEQHDGQTRPAFRKTLARKVFIRTAQYDAAISDYLARVLPGDRTPPPYMAVYGEGVDLRYGENPHQHAVLYRAPVATEADIAHAEVLHGKEMSYNNYVDADAALEAVRELCGRPAAAIIKHTNPCGYATGADLAEALAAAWSGDPVSAFGSVIAVTVPVDAAATHFLKGRFVEALIAPDFTPDALDLLKKKSKDIRLLKLPRPLTPPAVTRVARAIGGGLLVQDRDVGVAAQMVFPTENHFPEGKRPLAEFGMKVGKHIKSNAIAIVREYMPGQYSLLGMGAGQPNRVDAVKRLAIAKARENIATLYQSAEYGQMPKDFESAILSECVLVSDAFFPFPDSIEHAAEAGLRYIIQPGGSKKDEEVIAACDKYGIAMAFTGMRHFRH
jgi:phosphoribosylaminoimidazolecarboxamide formyltransferase/IMP cyclohydrolase